MSIHVGELHTDVITTPPPPGTPGQASADGQSDGGEARQRAAWICRRVSAEGFED
jgi:hypothetical protein